MLNFVKGPEFDQLFNLAEYANLTPKERDMYNTSLKHKWDNKNVLDYAVAQAELKADQKATERERSKAEKEKKEIALQLAIKLVAKKMPVEEIAELTGLTIKEIEAL